MVSNVPAGPTTVPCGRRLRIGEEAVLMGDTIVCSACADLLPHARPVAERRFTLERGAACGGGWPLD